MLLPLWNFLLCEKEVRAGKKKEGGRGGTFFLFLLRDLLFSPFFSSSGWTLDGRSQIRLARSTRRKRGKREGEKVDFVKKNLSKGTLHTFISN